MSHIYKNKGRDLTTTEFFNIVPLDLYFCTVHVVTFTLFKTQLMHLFLKHTFTSTFIKTLKLV
jgi:hypothetical protein